MATKIYARADGNPDDRLKVTKGKIYPVTLSLNPSFFFFEDDCGMMQEAAWSWSRWFSPTAHWTRLTQAEVDTINGDKWIYEIAAKMSNEANGGSYYTASMFKSTSDGDMLALLNMIRKYETKPVDMSPEIVLARRLAIEEWPDEDPEEFINGNRDNWTTVERYLKAIKAAKEEFV